MIPNAITGIHRGIIIANNDPDAMGRVKVFVPSVNAAMYENWFSSEGENQISFNGLGQNINSFLTGTVLEKLHMLLPWSEVAQPMFGMSSGGTFSAPENKSYIQPGPDDPCAVPGTEPTNPSQPNVISSDAAETRKRFESELQNPAVREKFYALMKAEVGGQGEQAQVGFAETVFNRATVQNTSINNIISNRKYYEPYQNGAFNRAANNLTSSNRQQYSNVISKVQGGSNITGGATHNASGSVAANAVSRYDARPESLKKVGGETYYSKTFEKKLNFTDSPTQQPPASTPPPPPEAKEPTIVEPPKFVDPNCDNTPSAPGTAFTDKTENRQNLAAGGEDNPSYPVTKDYNKTMEEKKPEVTNVPIGGTEQINGNTNKTLLPDSFQKNVFGRAAEKTATGAVDFVNKFRGGGSHDVVKG